MSERPRRIMHMEPFPFADEKEQYWFRKPLPNWLMSLVLLPWCASLMSPMPSTALTVKSSLNLRTNSPSSRSCQERFTPVKLFTAIDCMMDGFILIGRFRGSYKGTIQGTIRKVKPS